MTVEIADRVVACFQGIATGDAVGKQTEMLTQHEIGRWYPGGLRGLEGAAGSVIPRYAGNRKHQWRIGETTDDTERTLAVARAILRERAVSHASVGREMLACKRCVHPGVASLWDFHQAADPERIATHYDGCGAAIRIAPVGVFYASNHLDDIVCGAREASISTHGGSLAIAAAAANAAAVSAAIDGASAGEVFEWAERGAALAEKQWPGASPPAFASSLRRVHDTLAVLPALRPADVAACCFPADPLTIVPLALGVATLMSSAEEAIVLATNVGGDSDSVASIAGGILGAMHPQTINPDWCAVVEAVNGHDLVSIATDLAALRQ